MKRLKIFSYCLFSVVILAASFPGFNLSFLAWFGFLPLLWVIENQTRAKAFWLSYLCGFVFFILILYWLVHVTLVGLIILCLYLAFYFAFFGYFFTNLRHKRPHFNIPEIIFLSCIWVILEYLRSHLLSGFPWVLLGYSQYQDVKLIQFCDITGSLGLSFLVIFVNLCLFRLMVRKDKKSAVNVAVILLAIFTIIYSYGTYSINKHSKNKVEFLKVSLVQGNIPQEEKWSGLHREKIKKEYLDLSLRAKGDGADIIIWPETSYPEFIIEGDKESLSPMREIKAEIGKPLLFGSVYQKDGDYFNGAILLKDSERPQVYKKIHLVPFGEYLPLRNVFPFLEPFVPIGDFSFGDEFVIFNIENKEGDPVSFGALICFEDTVAELSRQFVLRGADFLVNITNDAWFKKTSSPYQHLQASVFRALENRVYLLRAANTGVTCIIDNCGRIIKRLGEKQGEDIFVKGFITGQINREVPQGVALNKLRTPQCRLSFYTEFGDWFILLCSLFTVCFIVTLLKKQKLQNL